jgi:hypothetical protein
MSSSGVIIVGTGEWAPVAAVAALSVQHTNPKLPIRIVSDRPINLPVPEIDVIQSDWHNRAIKTQVNQFTPWEHSLYLDADVLCLGPLDILGIDLGLAPEPLPAVERITHITGTEYDYTVKHYKGEPMFNGGVITWSRDAGKALFPRWHQEWLRFQGFDQLALARSLHSLRIDLGITPTELPWDYNFPIGEYRSVVAQRGSVRLLHAHTSEIGIKNWFEVARNVAPDAYLEAIALGVEGVPPPSEQPTG